MDRSLSQLMIDYLELERQRVRTLAELSEALRRSTIDVVGPPPAKRQTQRAEGKSTPATEPRTAAIPRRGSGQTRRRSGTSNVPRRTSDPHASSSSSASSAESVVAPDAVAPANVRRPIIDLESGERWESARDAAGVLGCTAGNVVNCCRGRQTRCAGRLLAYADAPDAPARRRKPVTPRREADAAAARLLAAPPSLSSSASSAESVVAPDGVLLCGRCGAGRDHDDRATPCPKCRSTAWEPTPRPRRVLT